MPAVLLDKPAKVVLAIRALYLVVALGIIRLTFTVIRHIDVRSPDFLILTKVLVYSVSIFLIYQLGKGKNWARWSLAAVLAVGIPLIILPVFGAIFHNPVYATLAILQLGLYVIALVLLFHESSSAWFKTGVRT
jgi:hypothetical protein